MRIVIIYRTIMGETIRHEFGPNNSNYENGQMFDFPQTERMLCKLSNESINMDNLSALIGDITFVPIFEYQCQITKK